MQLKNEKLDDFIGWVSPDGNLKVVGIAGKKGRATTYKVTCKICSQDPELFPLGYFISTKYNLKKGKKPCGCAKSCRWSEEQYLAFPFLIELGLVVNVLPQIWHCT